MQLKIYFYSQSNLISASRDNRIKSLHKEISSLETQRRNILNAVDKGIATDDLLEHLQDKKHEIERIKAKAKELENNAPKPIDEKEFKKLIEKTKEVIKQKVLMT